jgi:cell division protein FtsQ
MPANAAKAANPKKRASSNMRLREGRKLTRKRAARHRWHTTRRRTLIAAAALAAAYLAGAGAWYAHTGGFARTAHAFAAAFYQKTAQLGFRVDYVYVEGRRDTPLTALNQAIGVQEGEPILAVSVDDVRARVTALPRVLAARVERVLPNQLIIHVQERQPVAVWQYHEKLQLVDATGAVMPEAHPEKYNTLPLVVGEGAPAHVNALLALLHDQPELAKQVRAAVWVGDRRWDIHFANLDLKLPEENPALAWHRFALLNRDEHLLARDISYVDMRLSDRIYVKSATPAAPAGTTVSTAGSRDT